MNPFTTVSVVFCTRVGVFGMLCKEEGSSPVSVITERRDMGMYEVSLSMFETVFVNYLVRQFAMCLGVVATFVMYSFNTWMKMATEV